MTTSAVQLQHRRGSAAQVATFTGAQGEIVFDTTNNRLVAQDGATQGGFPAAKVTEINGQKYVLRTINLASANTDNGFSISLPPPFTVYNVTGVFLSQASATPSTSTTVGVFTATGAGGNVIVASNSTLALSSSSSMTSQSLTIISEFGAAYTSTAIYFRVQTASTVAVTVNVTLSILPLS